MQFALRTVRMSSGYTEDEVAKYCGIPTNVYAEIEIDPSQTQLSLIHKIAAFFGVSMSLIYSGVESECIKSNRKNNLSTF